MPLSVAIVGSGPAGFYTAEALLGVDAATRVDILERLPTPFGLVRGGVAPDHQTTKKVCRRYEKTARDARVRFYGNVEIGRDVSLDELSRIYDAVVLATGAGGDRPLGIPGEDKAGVFGSAAFVGWYNGHPDFVDLDPELDVDAVAVVGNGNVAIDVARVLVRTRDELAGTDIPDYARRAILDSPLTDVHMIGRRGPVEAKFTNVELREMGRLAGCVPEVDAAALPDGVGELSDRDRRLKERNLKTLREFSGRRLDEKPKRVHFRFFAAPREVLGGERVEGLCLERTRIADGRLAGTGETFDVACGLVVAAIGYRSDPVPGAPFDAERGIVPNDGGWVAGNLYVAGWIGRGPTGVIATNRADGGAVAGRIGEEVAGGGRPGREGLERLLGERGTRWVTYGDWKRIEAAEEAGAEPPAPRRKIVRVADMLSVLDRRDS